MTISKGSSWGGPGTISPDDPVAGSDRELRALVEASKRTGRPSQPLIAGAKMASNPAAAMTRPAVWPLRANALSLASLRIDDD